MKIAVIISVILLFFSIEAFSQANIPPEAEEGIYSMNYAGISNEFTAYIYKDSVYIPFHETLTFLGIYYKIESDGIIKGYVSNADTSFVINFKENYVVDINGKKKEISKDDYFRTELDWFIQPNIIEKIFLVNTAVYSNKLLVYVKSPYELPVLKEMKRQKKYTMLTPSEDYETANLPLISGNSFKLIDGGMLDYRLGAQQSHDSRNFTYMTNVGLQLFGGELQYNAFGNYEVKSKAGLIDNNLRWRYFLGENKILNQVSIGYLTNTSYRNVTVLNTSVPSIIMQGIQVSNETNRMPTSFSTFIISDKIDPGWQVELYVNKQLYAQTKSDNIGYYSFELPVKYGNTNVELKFYGPDGEFYRKTDFISIPSEYLAPGKVYYTLSGGKEVLSGNYLVNGKASVGITSWLTSSLNYSKYNKQKDYDLIGSASLRISGNFMLSGVVSPKKFYKGGLRINSENFGIYDIIYSVNKSVDSAVGINFNTIEFDGGFPRILNLPVNLTFRAINSDYPDVSTTNISAYLTFNLYSLMLTGRYYAYMSSDKITKKFDMTHSINPQIDYSWYSKPKFLKFLGNTRFTIGSIYDLNVGKILNMDFTLSQEITRGTNLMVNLRRDLPSKITSINLTLMMNLTNVLANANWTSDLEGNNSYSEDISGILGFDSRKFNFYFSNPTGKTFLGSGAATVRFFVDRNGNGQYDEGEDEVKGVDFYVPNGTIEQGSPSGGKRVYNLLPGGVCNVFVKKESFKNPFIVPKMTEFSFVAEPNAYKNIDVPCYMTGIIEGQITKIDGSDTSGQGGVKVHIVNKENKDEISVPVFSDGGFYKNGIMPGKYSIFIDSLQLSLLDCTPVPRFIDFEVRSLADGDYVTGLGFTIYPRSGAKEKVVETLENKPVKKDTMSSPIVPKKNSKPVLNKNDKNKIEVAEPTKLTQQTINEKVFFYKNTNDFIVSAEMGKYLDSLRLYLKKNPGAKISLIGHSDNFSTKENEHAISNKRCQAVAGYLISKGVDKNKILIKAEGSDNPLSPNTTPEGRAKNRRIEIKILK